MTILFVSGASDENIGEFRGLDGRGNIIWTVNGCCDVEKYLHLKPGVAGSILMFGPKIKQSDIRFHRTPSLVFNQISEPDTHAGALSRCAAMCRQLSAPVINRPENIMNTTRDRVSELLQGIAGVTMPKTVRVNPRNPDEVFEQAESVGLQFPFIVRLAGFHNGRNMVLLRSREDYDELHAFPFDGRDFYLTEFVDYKNDSGIYIKQRIAVIDDKPFIRHCLFDQSWKIHVSSLDFMEQNRHVYSDGELMEKSEARLSTLQPAIMEIRKRLGLEYFGIDCHIDDQGGMLIFEANANMNILVISAGENKDKTRFLRTRVAAMISRRSGERLY